MAEDVSGTIVMAAAVVAVLVRNERREIVFVGVIRVSMATPPIIARQEFLGFSASDGGHTSTRLLQGLADYGAGFSAETSTTIPD